MVWVVVGITVLVIAVIAYFGRERLARELAEMQRTPTSGKPNGQYTEAEIRGAQSKGPARAKTKAEPPRLDTSDGAPRCPKCGGVQFKARRTVGQRMKVGTATVMTGGAGGLVAAKAVKQRVQCITCGTFYARIAKGER
ncbi:hypothetical protein [Cellulomonas sp. C5510]|uniref:hypothetical protein n=1 Tax=Cellulomonas sp. C5510 TaxID=2871170 RepID=UPI001C948448|nr:hypothetical protein [Cellulomonas sp. C5510]QZN86944.1 hypothetical protein K5O09_07490 [Cellulomonas sp. C5510]